MPDGEPISVPIVKKFIAKMSGQNPVITFLSDFGTKDGYAGSVKGVLKSNFPEFEIIDISHEIEPCNIRQAAFTLLNYYNEFPKGTIHLAVVDPGVGSKRRALVVKTKDYQFIGPDNGIFHYIFQKEKYHAFAVISEKLVPLLKSRTFHARDLFAPVAARLAQGTAIEEMGALIKNVTRLKLKLNPKNRPEISVVPLSQDRFGNIIFGLNKRELKARQLAKIKCIRFKNFETAQINAYYAEKRKGAPLVLWNSQEFLEIAVNQGRAAEKFNLNLRQDKLTIKFE